MSVIKDKRSGRYLYDFWLFGRRHKSPAFERRSDAEDAEASLKRTLRRRQAGLEALDAKDTPRFTDWAAVTLHFQQTRKGIKRPDQARITLRQVLAFWGAKPKTKALDDGEYRDLRLGDPIKDPELLLAFEKWMTARGLSGARKNHYRSACSMMYRVALLPERRGQSGIRENPFAGVLRDRVQRRTRLLEPAEITTWMDAAPLPVMLAVTLGALAPALRLQNVVGLRRDQLSPARDFLTVAHKADRETGMPLTLAISGKLRQVLKKIEELYPKDAYVIPLDAIAGGRPGARGRRALATGQKPRIDAWRYWRMIGLVRKSIKAAGLTYGRGDAQGVTFHSLRHAMNTWLVRQGVTAEERQRAMGHETLQMQQWYTHLAGADTVRAMELLGDKLPIADLALERLRALEAERPREVPAAE